MSQQLSDTSRRRQPWLKASDHESLQKSDFGGFSEKGDIAWAPERMGRLEEKLEGKLEENKEKTGDK